MVNDFLSSSVHLYGFESASAFPPGVGIDGSASANGPIAQFAAQEMGDKPADAS
jgi:hypothetical protein